MSGATIIARRIPGGYVQYGWCGNGGTFDYVGVRIRAWYNTPEMVEYLFGLGELSAIGKPHSEDGGESMYLSTVPTGHSHWLGRSETEIFSKECFIDNVYFFDSDNTWYYVIPWAMNVKIPLEYISRNADEHYSEYDVTHRTFINLLKYLLGDYYEADAEFRDYVARNYQQDIAEIRKVVFESSGRSPFLEDSAFHRSVLVAEKYPKLYEYFDEWVVAVPNSEMTDIAEFVVKRAAKKEERTETAEWCRSA